MSDFIPILRKAGVFAATDPLVTIAGQTVHRMIVRGTGAVAMWRKLHTLANRSGHWPVMCGEADDAQKRWLALAGHDPAPLLQQADEISLDAWQTERIAEDPDRFDYDPRPWPTDPPPPLQLSVALDPVAKSPWPSVLITLLPISASADAFAWLNFGGFADAPAPPLHVAFARRWSARWSADLAALTADVAEFLIARPPTTREDALALAREHYLYCPATVDHDAGTVEALAARLLRADVWRFWWE